MVDRRDATVWEVLENVITGQQCAEPCSTLHRLGIQAFQPVLITIRYIKTSLYCFNADFDGDQMAVPYHLAMMRS